MRIMVKKYYRKLCYVFKAYYSEFKKIRIDRRIVIFSFFFLISAFLWFLQVLGSQYITTLPQPIEFTGTYDTIVVQNPDKLPKKLDIKVQAKGYDILRHNFSFFRKKIKLNFQNLNLIPENPGDSIHYYFYTNTVKNYFQSKIGNDLKVLEILPDTLSFNFTRYTFKNLRIVPHVTLNYFAGYKLKGKLSLKPDKIRVYGPEFILDSLEAIYTQKRVLKDLNEDLNQEIKLVLPKRIESETNYTIVYAHISQFTELSKKIPIKIINKPDSLRIILFPNSINIRYQIFIEDISMHENLRTQGIIDYKQTLHQKEKLGVKLINQSNEMFNIRYYPKYVNFIIEKIK